MAFGRSISPTSAGTSGALPSTHIVPHSASAPPKPAPVTNTSAAPPTHTDTTSPPSLSQPDHDAFASLRPTSSHRETVAYTAAASARGRSLDRHGDSEAEFDPHRRTRVPSPTAALKALPDAAARTLGTAAPARALDAIKSKLAAPSTAHKSKSDIAHSLDAVERDMRHNADAPGNVRDDKDAPATKSGSFSSLLARKAQRSKPAASMQPSTAPQRKSSTVRHDDDVTREEEEEEDDEVVQQRIRDQQKRLEDLDEAQTIGLLRTQQEAGIEPVQSPVSPAAKPSWLVGLPLFGSGAGSSKDQQDDAQGEGSSSRRSSFRRGRSRRRAHAADSDAATDHEDDHAPSTRRTASLPRSSSMKLSTAPNRQQPPVRSASASRAARSKSRPRADAHTRSSSGGLVHPPRRQSLTWTSKLRTKIPIKEFPLQGSGRESEFNQDCPLWARQPWKYMYFSYFGLSIGLYHLPRWAVSSILPSHRARPGWSWKKATMVQLYRHGCQLTFRTRTSLGRDLQKEVPHSKTVRCKFAWVDPVGDADVRGELRRAMLLQNVHPQRTCGFWYGDVAKQGKHGKQHRGHAQSHTQSGESSVDSSSERTPTQEEVDALRESEASLGAGSQNSGTSSQREVKGGVGRPAEPGEKVLYHLHGGAYWIGTAHEKDVTAAVNTESLRYMAEIYKARDAATGSSSDSGASASSPYANKLLRSFSLDYLLCVPGRPRAGSYPAALLDALSGYLYLVRELGFSPENVIVAGDSAGGNLAMALCRYLRDEGEQIAKQPGALLLMSPWVDVSRSHSGPTGAPNLDSSVYLNQDSDIISSLIAFRNTAVSAFLGDLPARETYRNPYISPVSLQLPLERGGQAPHYGFHGFPKKIYITTGSAEISYDQHLTLAHRLASGTQKGRPVYTGDRLSAGCNAREMAERRNRPRPKEMLDAEQNAISVTPLDELQGMQLVAEPEAMDGVGGGHAHTARESGDEQLSSVAAGKRRLHASPPPEPSQKEDRQVVLDEVKDAVHDYLLFKWFEPERTCTWRRIAQWIDEV
ncbi:conserved hypothetical protein [Sporisorium reilianum SRZ2]|uniref:Alpha/beta hydrolase fold-3 domain-containing protein n=1 Tax=Sporisorium reilianum (strain SRZ2) TaxID=999809 RepID=E6ZSX0_SPORE|nr:conserved hypothetical protein [Sporisorium reilianum SRZ2]